MYVWMYMYVCICRYVCVTRVVQKAGGNQGKTFYACARLMDVPDKCGI